MSERKKRLIETMKALNKEFEEETIFFGDEIKDKEIISTGIKRIDKFFGGGFKRGTHTILWGDISNGKTTLALQAIGHAQKQGYTCAYLNTEKPIDNIRFDMLGVNRKELLRADCTKNAEQMLTIVKRLCREKVVDMIVVDSINALCPKAELETKKGKEKSLEDKTIAELARLLSEFCRRVNPDVYNANCAMVWIGQLRIGGIGTFYTRAVLSCGKALKFYAYTIAYLRKGEAKYSPVKKFKEYYIDPDGKIRFQTKSEKIGFPSVFRMEKTNSGISARENSEENFPFIGVKGFVDEIVESEDIPITIDPEANEEEKKKIEDYLIKKEIYPPVTVEGVEKAKKEEAPKKPEPPALRELTEGEEAPVNKKVKEMMSKPIKKRGRGRPKKDKK